MSHQSHLHDLSSKPGFRSVSKRNHLLLHKDIRGKIAGAVLIWIMVSCILFSTTQTALAQAGSADDLIREVNALRSSQGLPALTTDSALMTAAQRHADYQASVGYLTHTGPGGSRPLDRAVAAGFGGGSDVFVSENIAVGRNISPGQTVTTVWTDSVQLNTMVNAQFTHIGAGVAVVDGLVYYTIDTGYIAGDSGAQAHISPTPAGQTEPAAQQATQVIATNTPKSDGSIAYEVQPGDSLWSIAIAHNIKIEDIQRYNNMGSSEVVQLGGTLLLAPTYTPTLVPTETNTPLPPTRTPRPTLTPRPPTAIPSATHVPETLTPTSAPPQSLLPGMARGSDARRYLGIGMIVICGLGLVIILIGGLKKR